MGLRKKIEEIRSRVGLSNIRLDQLRNSVRSLKSIEEQQSKEIERLRNDLKTNAKEINRLSEELKVEFRRRDVWERKKAEVQRLAKGKEILVIKCPALERRGAKSVDYAYCDVLKRYFEEAGYYVLIDCYEDWNCSINADVVVLIHGYRYFHPDRRDENTKFVMWINCFPDKITAEELALYDLVVTTSETHQKMLQQITDIPVEFVPMLTDTDSFYPSDTPTQPKYNCVFIGNIIQRKYPRDCIRWCNDNGIEVDVWGEGWDKFYANSMFVHLHGRIDYKDLPELYRNARFSLNDHFADMLESEMMNNRFPEVLLSGIPMVCDWAESFERNYGDMVLFYRNEEEFVHCMKEMEERYDELRANVMKNQDKLKEEFDFRRGIERMKALIDDISQ